MPLDFPNSPSTNRTYSSDGVTWRWDGEKWRLVGGTTQPKVQVSDTAPTRASAGDAWVDTDTGSLFVFYDGFWVTPRVPNAIGSGAIGTTQLAGGAVTTEKLALGPTFVSTLPSSPVDGQEVYYQASGDMATNGIVWHLRYRSGSSSSYKWEYIGGPPIYSENVAAATRAVSGGTARADIPSGIDRSVPVAGNYLVTHTAIIHLGAAGSNRWANTGYRLANSAGTTVIAASGDYAIGFEEPTAGAGATVTSVTYPREVATAGSRFIEHWERNTQDYVLGVWRRRIFVTPIRVG